MTVKRLTRTEIQDLLGPQSMESVEDLEILFNGFQELDCLDNFPKLRRLCCVDNGINRISNLEPVSMTLTILNLSDQDISKIENLNLPNLVELYLHRNFIRSMGGLSGCPRLKKLWLCQNQISTISDMHNLPELEEFWAQSNKLTSLQGLENCRRLTHLSVAGNHITDFAEIRRLGGLSELRILCFQDIHFGRCPIADSDGYKEFIMNHLKQVSQLDGVTVSPAAAESAKTAQFNEIRRFNEMIQTIEAKHREDLQSIAYKQQARTSHSSVLEKEMQSALVELEQLIMDGRNTIGQQVQQQQGMLQRNISDLQSRIDDMHDKAAQHLERSTISCRTEYDMAEAMFYTIEMVYDAFGAVVDVLCSVTSGLSPSKHQLMNVAAPTVMHHPVSDNAPDFKYMASLVRGKVDGSHPASDGVLTVGLVKLFRLHFLSKSHGLDEVSIAKTRDGDSVVGSDASLIRVFTVLRPDQLGNVIRDGWSSLSETLVFSSHPGVASSLYSEDGGSQFRLPDIHFQGYSSGTDFSGPIMEENEMTCLLEAKKMQPLLLVSCELDLKKSGMEKFMQSGSAGATIRIPSAESARREMLHELKKARKCLCVNIDHGRGQMFVVPKTEVKESDVGDLGSFCAGGLYMDYVCLCTSPPIEDGLRGLELRMETMAMPTAAESDWLNKSGNSQSSFLAKYDAQMYREVHTYVDQVLEELDSNDAGILRAAQDEMDSKEAALRVLKEELAQERRIQETILKDVKQSQPPQPASQGQKMGGHRGGRR